MEPVSNRQTNQTVKPRIIVIVGPTGSGKTALGIDLAKRLSGEIIAVDSRTIYRGMDIATAKPNGQWSENVFVVEGVPYWGIDVVDPDEPYSAADFKAYAKKKIDEIMARGRLPILVGGTGFWLKTVIDNLDLTSTPSDPALRAELELRPLADLLYEYQQLDPVGAGRIDTRNKRRVVRALEVTKLTGKPWSQQLTAGESLYDVLQIGLDVPRTELNERINRRVDEMVAKGLVEEVERLKEKYGCEIESMTGIGYRQVCLILSDRTKLDAAFEEIKRDTRAYAKRQMTWFERDPRIVWVRDAMSAYYEVTRFLA